MREYSKVSSSFWIGDTGRQLRKLGAEVQVAALYLITAPGASWSGIYYLPLPTFCHETGLTTEGGSEALARLSEAGFAHYDAQSEMVWVVEMARFQIGERLSAKDNRHKMVLRELESHRKCKFVKDFYAKYKECFELPDASSFEGTWRPLRSIEMEIEIETPPNPPQAGGGCAVTNARKKTAAKGKSAGTSSHPLFAKFWEAYPRKVAKPRAVKAFAKLNPDEALVAVMLLAIAQQTKSEDWLKQGGQFIPHPASWLNDKRWEDESPTATNGVVGAPPASTGLPKALT